MVKTTVNYDVTNILFIFILNWQREFCSTSFNTKEEEEVPEKNILKVNMDVDSVKKIYLIVYYGLWHYW